MHKPLKMKPERNGAAFVVHFWHPIYKKTVRINLGKNAADAELNLGFLNAIFTDDQKWRSPPDDTPTEILKQWFAQSGPEAVADVKDEQIAALKARIAELEEQLADPARRGVRVQAHVTQVSEGPREIKVQVMRVSKANPSPSEVQHTELQKKMFRKVKKMEMPTEKARKAVKAQDEVETLMKDLGVPRISDKRRRLATALLLSATNKEQIEQLIGKPPPKQQDPRLDITEIVKVDNS